MSKPQSWEVSDGLWKKVEPLIPPRERNPNDYYWRKIGGGRKPGEPRKVFEAIVYVLRTGIQWKEWQAINYAIYLIRLFIVESRRDAVRSENEPGLQRAYLFDLKRFVFSINIMRIVAGIV